ncbi:MAG: hypothetical protein ACRDL2_06290, partial [Gaiellaceae bacterium]
MLVLVSMYVGPIAIVLRQPSIGVSSIESLPALSLPSFSAPVFRVPRVSALPALPAIAAPSTPSSAAPAKTTAVKHNVVPVVSDTHSVLLPQSTASSTPTDPYAKAAVVEDDVGSLATIPASAMPTNTPAQPAQATSATTDASSAPASYAG